VSLLNEVMSRLRYRPQLL